MKRVVIMLSCFCLLLLCGCGARMTAEPRTLPDVRILDETPQPAAETQSPAPIRTAVAARAPMSTEKPAPSPSPSASPEPTDAPEPTPNPALCPYVGSRNSEIYHLADCSQAQRIKAENLLGWESREAAEAAGRTPCKACLSEKPEKTPEPTAAPKATETPTETSQPVLTPAPTAEAQPEDRVMPDEYAYVGSKNSEVYHLAGCSQAQRIKAENLLGWESAEAAEAAGRTPCKVCLPEMPEETPEPVPTPTEPVIPIATPEPTAEAQPEERFSAGEYVYVGSRNSNKYHLPDCRYAQNIDEANRVGWMSRAEAEAAGYEACKVCKP